MSRIREFSKLSLLGFLFLPLQCPKCGQPILPALKLCNSSALGRGNRAGSEANFSPAVGESGCPFQGTHLPGYGTKCRRFEDSVLGSGLGGAAAAVNGVEAACSYVPGSAQQGSLGSRVPLTYFEK